MHPRTDYSESQIINPLYNVGIDLHMIYCDICLCTFGKSTTLDETITVGKGVPSNSTPYCNLTNVNLVPNAQVCGIT